MRGSVGIIEYVYFYDLEQKKAFQWFAYVFFAQQKHLKCIFCLPLCRNLKVETLHIFKETDQIFCFFIRQKPYKNIKMFTLFAPQSPVLFSSFVRLIIHFSFSHSHNLFFWQKSSKNFNKLEEKLQER